MAQHKKRPFGPKTRADLKVGATIPGPSKGPEKRETPHPTSSVGHPLPSEKKSSSARHGARRPPCGQPQSG